MLTVAQIQDIIPHRYPFLLIDRIIEVEEGRHAVGIKNVTINEPYFTGHFPNCSIMPGVLIVEALAQVGAVVILGMKENENKLPLFAGIENFRFRRQVFPGDVLTLVVEITRLKSKIGKGQATAKVNDKVVAEGELMFALSDRN